MGATIWQLFLWDGFLPRSSDFRCKRRDWCWLILTKTASKMKVWFHFQKLWHHLQFPRPHIEACKDNEMISFEFVWFCVLNEHPNWFRIISCLAFHINIWMRDENQSNQCFLFILLWNLKLHYMDAAIWQLFQWEGYLWTKLRKSHCAITAENVKSWCAILDTIILHYYFFHARIELVFLVVSIARCVFDEKRTIQWI